MKWQTSFVLGSLLLIASTASADSPSSATGVDAWPGAAAPAPVPNAWITPIATTADAGSDKNAAAACPVPTTACDDHSGFSVKIIPYLWLPGSKGHVTDHGVSAHFDVSIGKAWDIVTDDLDMLAIGQIEAYAGDFGILFNGVYYRVDPEGRVHNVTFNGGFKQTILDLAAVYNLAGGCSSHGCGNSARFELLAGVRYYELGASGVTLTGDDGRTATFSNSKEWLDIIVGGRIRLPIGDCLTAQIRGDVGGFDLPQSSRYSWNVEGTLEFNLSCNCAIFGGWRILDVDRQRGEGDSKFGYNTQLSGPMAGLSLKF